ncbi:minor capsid protein [Phyllobacterium myrsinacearum]|uniref:DUF3168 domain-containing protein n=1 Tax=Phyllobacterium myrsinacearum TaxID=28101 RepID=A0A839EZC3_9HYPH|nr:minor capsid protein [Phyllobacterium myrsinacearum]MBA8881727.1 hypothetical protein [Phyllobacterium myrsinacearum]
MIWDILIAKIEAAGLAAAGNDMFINDFPAEVDTGVMLKSPLAGIAIDPNLPGYYTPNLQIIVRHKDPVEGEKLAAKLNHILYVEAPERYEQTAERGAVQINIFRARSLPIRYPRQEGGSIEWSLNYSTSFTIQARS